MTKSLHTDGIHYTSEANWLRTEAEKALKPIMQHWLAKGYSVREIAHLMHGAVTDVELAALPDLMIAHAKAKTAKTP